MFIDLPLPLQYSTSIIWEIDRDASWWGGRKDFFLLLFRFSFFLFMTISKFQKNLSRSTNLINSITCIQRPPKGNTKSCLLQQVVFKCMLYYID